MDYFNIQKNIISVFKKADIKSFPIDCFQLFRLYGYDTIRYSELSKGKRNACIALSEDACIIENTLYYNDSKRDSRIRFSFMHELGHIILESDQEGEANYFASNIIAPRIAIYYACCSGPDDVSQIFGLSYEASDYAFEDYRRWKQCFEDNEGKLTSIDKMLYDHFYNEKEDAFVWKIKKCDDCRNLFYNTAHSNRCDKCRIPEKYRKKVKHNLYSDSKYGPFTEEESIRNFKIAVNRYLYRDDL